MNLLRRSFRFLEHGPLVDDELELVPPQRRWLDAFLSACHHPQTVERFPRESRITRADVERFLGEAPLGRLPADEATGRVPSYQFWMLLRHEAGRPDAAPPVRIAGGLSLRVGGGEAVERYYGHVGYHVYPPARGHAYAYRASRLVLPIARAHGLRHLWLTCDPDNAASRRTIERLGGRYVDTVQVPPTEPLYERGETVKCRFSLTLG